MVARGEGVDVAVVGEYIYSSSSLEMWWLFGENAVAPQERCVGSLGKNAIAIGGDAVTRWGKAVAH